MLIIARRKGQRLVIGNDIEVVVSEISRGVVKLGIVAPARTPILRGELRDAVEAANRDASQASAIPSTLPLALPEGPGPWGRRT